MIIYLCIKFQSNTPILSKDIARKPTYGTDGTGRTDGTDVRTDSGDTICAPPPPPSPTENGGGIKTCKFKAQNIWQYLGFLIFSPMLWANSADDKLMIFFLIFLENRIWHFMQILLTICMECQILFSWKNNKNISKCHLLKFFTQHAKCNILRT